MSDRSGPTLGSVESAWLPRPSALGDDYARKALRSPHSIAAISLSCSKQMGTDQSTEKGWVRWQHQSSLLRLRVDILETLTAGAHGTRAAFDVEGETKRLAVGRYAGFR